MHGLPLRAAFGQFHRVHRVKSGSTGVHVEEGGGEEIIVIEVQEGIVSVAGGGGGEDQKEEEEEEGGDHLVYQTAKRGLSNR